MATTNAVDQINLSDTMQTPPVTPQPSKTGKFLGALGKAGSIAGNIFLPGVGGIVGDMLTGMGVSGVGADPTQYLRLQQRIQAQSQAFEAVSSVLKAKHDAAMDSLRNIAH